MNDQTEHCEIPNKVLDVADPQFLSNNKEVVLFHLYNDNGLVANRRWLERVGKRVVRLAFEQQHPQKHDIEEFVTACNFHSKGYLNMLCNLEDKEHVSSTKLKRAIRGLQLFNDKLHSKLRDFVGDLFKNTGRYP